MRITTQMLNEQARRSGISINRSTLLDYVNNDKKTDSLFKNLNAGKLGLGNATSGGNYKKLENSSNDLLEQLSIFLDESEDSIFERLKAEENPEENGLELYDNITNFIESYNETVKNIKLVPGTLNDYYRKMMNENASENEELLKSIGINLNSDGTLSLDEDKLKACGIENIREVLGAAGTFSVKTAIIASGISDNANANTASISNQYNSHGNIYSAMQNKYDTRG